MITQMLRHLEVKPKLISTKIAMEKITLEAITVYFLQKTGSQISGLNFYSL